MEVLTIEKKKSKSSLKRYKFKVKDILKMYQSGVFNPQDKVELLNGEVYKMSPIGFRHAITVNILNRILGEIILQDENLKNTFIIQIQNPIFIDEFNLPQPDVAVVKSDYIKEKNHPKPNYVELIIEVSDSTVEKDRELKLPIYAKAKIKEVWIVNLNNNHIEVYTEPHKKEYLKVNIYPSDKNIKIFDNDIPVRKILNLS